MIVISSIIRAIHHTLQNTSFTNCQCANRRIYITRLDFVIENKCRFNVDFAYQLNETSFVQKPNIYNILCLQYPSSL